MGDVGVPTESTEQKEKLNRTKKTQINTENINVQMKSLVASNAIEK